MALTKVTLQTSQLVAVKEDTADWKAAIKCLVYNATARNMVDLLLVITILVLLGIAAPIIRGDHCVTDAENKVEGYDFKCAARASCLKLNNSSTGNCACVCHAGFSGDGHNCTDIDECASGNNSCPTHAHCRNAFGSYTCECYRGYHGNQCIDVDECEVGIHSCDENANCTNTAGSYKCTCHVGFDANGISCKDVNECKAGSHNCGQGGKCMNTEGSYRCV